MRRTTPLGRWWRYKVFWPAYRALMPNRTKRIFLMHRTYSKPGRQWNGWADRTFISDRWKPVLSLRGPKEVSSEEDALS